MSVFFLDELVILPSVPIVVIILVIVIVLFITIIIVEIYVLKAFISTCRSMIINCD